MSALADSPISEIRRSFIAIVIALGLRALERRDLGEYKEWQVSADVASKWRPGRGA